MDLKQDLYNILDEIDKTEDFENSLIPIVKEFITKYPELNNYPIDIPSELKENYYLFCSVIILLNSENTEIIPLHIIKFAMIYEPSINNLFCVNKTKKEWKKHLKNLNIEPKKHDKHNYSAIAYFNYLFGFHFIPELVDTTINNALNIINQKYKNYNIIFINASYKTNYDKMTVYNNLYYSKEIILSKDNVYFRKPFYQFNIDNKIDKPIYFLNDNMETDTWFIGIDYNTFPKHYISIAFFGENHYLTKEEKDKFLKGIVMKQIDISNIKCEIMKKFYSTRSQEKEDQDELVSKIRTLVKITHESFIEENPELSIENVLKHSNLKKVLDNTEIPIFECYLQYCKIMDEFNQINFVKYVNYYFYEPEI